MSSDFIGDSNSDSQKTNWMLEDFPADVKQRCKECAVSQRRTLKAFVENALRAAVGMPAAMNKSVSAQETSGTNSSRPTAKPAAKSRDKSQKATSRAS